MGFSSLGVWCGIFGYWDGGRGTGIGRGIGHRLSLCEVLSRWATREAIYVPCLKVIIAHCFTCGEKKIWENIKKSQNIMKNDRLRSLKTVKFRVKSVLK